MKYSIDEIQEIVTKYNEVVAEINADAFDYSFFDGWSIRSIETPDGMYEFAVSCRADNDGTVEFYRPDWQDEEFDD